MIGRCRLSLAVGVVLMGLSSAQAPTLISVLPRGGQRGAELTVELKGRKLGGALDLMFSDGALELVELKQEAANRIEARVRVIEGAPPGPRWLRVRTATGLSNLLNFSVGAFPHVEEAEPNGSREEAALLELGDGASVTVRGVADLEDMDVFRVDGRAGQQLSVEVEAMRIGSRLDAAVSVVDAAGFVLRSCDDVAFARQDPAFTVELPRDGPYFIRVRQATYRGSKDAHYLLHVGAFPRPYAVLPMGGPPGEPLEVELLGGAGSLGRASVTVPSAGTHGGWIPAGAAAVPVEVNGIPAPTPCWLRPSPLTNHTEPTDGSVMTMAVPGAFNGCLEVPGDTDRFAFEVVKGETYVVDVWARRLRSPVDSVLRLRRDPSKAPVKVNDDAEGQPDSAMQFTAKGGGVVELEILDQLRRGGPEFTYRVEVTLQAPSIKVSTPRPIKAAAVPRGGRALAILRVERERVPDELERHLSGLPEGVTATILELPPGLGVLPILLEAAPDAPLAHSELEVRVEGGGASAGMMDERTLVEGANQTYFWAQTVRGLALAVTEPAPMELFLEIPDVPMPRRGALDVVVRVKRAEGITGPVTAALSYLPQGVTSSRQVTIPAGADQGTISLNTAPDARIGRWSMVVEGGIEGPASRVRVASAPATLEVTPPFLTGKAQALSLARTDSGPLLVEVTRREACPGGGKLLAQGLPRGVSSAPVELGAEPGAGEVEVLVPMEVAADSPTGKHSGLVLNAVFELPGGRVVQSVASAELRIKRAPAAARASKPKPAPAPEEVPARPLTRLQKLRAEHAEQVGGAPGGDR